MKLAAKTEGPLAGLVVIAFIDMESGSAAAAAAVLAGAAMLLLSVAAPNDGSTIACCGICGS